MTAPPMPVYRGWTRGQLQLFVPVGKGESWTGYACPARPDAQAIRPTPARDVNTAGTETAHHPGIAISERRDWRHSAACRDVADPDMFFPPNGSRTDLDSPAKERCGGCPVQADCLEWALGTRQRFGIYGGATRHERRRIARSRAIANGKAAAVNRDEAQDWLRRNADDPFIIEQLGKTLADLTSLSPAALGDMTGPLVARKAMLALADMLDEADI